MIVAVVEFFSNVTGINVNTTKSAVTVISMSKSGQRTSRDPKLTYGPDKTPIAALSGSQSYRYLGGEAGGSGSSRNTVKRVREFSSSVALVCTSQTSCHTRSAS